MGVYKREYKYINNFMDGSNFKHEEQDLNNLENQKTYFEFKNL